MSLIVPEWFGASELTYVQRAARAVLQSGRVPRHVAFIMDGNRRYARQRLHARTIDGHRSGFEQLSRTLKWCRDFGIIEVTVYAFSIENFKRSREEVDGIMQLAHDKFEQLIAEKDSLAEEQVRFRFIGNWSLLPTDLQQLMARIEQMTCTYNKAFVNVCIAYTSQDEMHRAAESVLGAVHAGILDADDVCDDVFTRALDMPDTPDLLVRTSGEQRLSDFLLWQCSYTCLYFADVLWPEFGFWHLCTAILHYQHNCDGVHAARQQRMATLGVPKLLHEYDQWLVNNRQHTVICGDP